MSNRREGARLRHAPSLRDGHAESFVKAFDEAARNRGSAANHTAQRAKVGIRPIIENVVQHGRNRAGVGRPGFFDDPSERAGLQAGVREDEIRAD